MKLRDSEGYERIVMAEVLVPDIPNVYGDLHTKDNIKQFCYAFAMTGFGIDVNHDNIDRSGELVVVESFIARTGDPDFIEGSWVVGVLVKNDDIWDAVLSGEISGFSYEAIVKFIQVIVNLTIPKVISGVTEPDLYDGHTHNYTTILDSDGRVVAGGTDEVNNHTHTILAHTSTEMAQSHRHRYALLDGDIVEEQ